jgi:hypothetical protein
MNCVRDRSLSHTTASLCTALLAATQELDVSGSALPPIPAGAGQAVALRHALPASLLSGVSSLTRLTALDISRRPVDAKLLAKALKQLPHLAQLALHEVPLPPETVAQLERRVPQVMIQRHTRKDNAPDLAALCGSLSAS